MKTFLPGLIALSAILLFVPSLRAEEVSRRVSLKTPDGQYLTASANLSLDLSGTKVGSLQTFTLVDTNGGSLEDGDEVQIKYIPNKDGTPNPDNASWASVVDNAVKRNKTLYSFKVKQIETLYALQTIDGKFVAADTDALGLRLTDAESEALRFEVTDVDDASVVADAPAEAAAAEVADAPEN